MGKIYVGSSVDIRKRFKQYNNLSCTEQTHLYRSFLKYGVANHVFIIVKQCDASDTRRNEAIIGQKLGAIGPNGLNCQLPKINDEFQCVSEELRQKRSESNKGRKASIEARINMRNAQLGKKHTLERRLNNSRSKKGIIFTEEHRRRISQNKKRKILNTITGKIYMGHEAAAESIGMKRTTLVAMLRGQNPNKSPFIYLISK